MYSEKTFKNYIFWLQVRRIFLMILLSIIGAVIGVLIGKFLESTVQIKSYTTIIIIVSTLLFFAISVLMTVGTGKEIQDGYWKIAVLRKLTVIQKDLEFNNELLSKSGSMKRPLHNEMDFSEEENDEQEVEISKQESALGYKPEMGLVRTNKKNRKEKRKKKIALRR